MGHLLLVVPLLVGVLWGARLPISDNSLLWHVKAGELQLHTGEVLRADPFSFTMAGAPWRTQSWVADLGYALLEGAVPGLGWVPGLLGTAGALTVLLLALAVYQRVGEVRRAAVIAVPAGILALPLMVPRPVLLANLLLVLLVLCLRRPDRVGWAAPLLLWLWAGVHGSFVVGLGLLVLEALRRGGRGGWWLVGASMVTTGLTAHGWRVWETLFRFAESRQALSFIQEWGPPAFGEFPAIVYAGLLGVLLLAAARGSIAPRDLWVVLPFALFGLTTFRALLPATLVVAPWAATVWGRVSASRSSPVSSPVALGNWGVLLAVPLIAVFLLHPGAARLEEGRFPVRAALHLADGPTFHDEVTGGWLIYAQWPDRRVYIDDRAELYGGRRFAEYVAARRGLAWEDLFGRNAIDQALLRVGDPLGTILELEGWERAYQDAGFVVLRSSSGSGR